MINVQSSIVLQKCQNFVISSNTTLLCKRFTFGLNKYSFGFDTSYENKMTLLMQTMSFQTLIQVKSYELTNHCVDTFCIVFSGN